MSEPEVPAPSPHAEPVPARGTAVRLFASTLALAAGTAALVVAIVLLKGVLS
ncbi:MAG: hypothetical protein WCB67_08665 [Solirubrobacteraceae bacterium]